jgi:hypothetical protein
MTRLRSGPRPQKATYRRWAVNYGTHSVTVRHRPEPQTAHPSQNTHGSSGWGEAPLDVGAEIGELRQLEDELWSFGGR